MDSLLSLPAHGNATSSKEKVSKFPWLTRPCSIWPFQALQLYLSPTSSQPQPFCFLLLPQTPECSANCLLFTLTECLLTLCSHPHLPISSVQKS